MHQEYEAVEYHSERVRGWLDAKPVSRYPRPWRMYIVCRLDGLVPGGITT